MQVEFRGFALRAAEGRAQSDAPGRNGNTCEQTPLQEGAPYAAHPLAKQQPRLTGNPSGQNLTSTFLETRNCFDLHTAFTLSPGFNVGAKQKKLGGGLVDAARSLATLIERGRGENKKWKLSIDHCCSNSLKDS